MAEKMNLRQKLASIYTTVSHIDKYGESPALRYTFVRAADVLHTIRKTLVALGVYAQTNYTLLGTYEIKTNKGGSMHVATVRADIVFFDTDSNETISVSGLGDGADSGDKGIYKAQTGATKNALRNAFLVPDEADPEADASVDAATSGQYEEPAPQPVPVRKIMGGGKSTGMRSTPYGAETQVIEVPTPGGDAEVPKSHIPSSFEEVPESGNPQPAAPTRKRGQSAPAASPSMPTGGTLPTEAELGAYRERFVQFGGALRDAGLKVAGKLTPTQKAIPYLLQTTGQSDVMQITTLQWDTFFQFVDKTASLENGIKQLVKLVNDAAATPAAKG